MAIVWNYIEVTGSGCILVPPHSKSGICLPFLSLPLHLEGQIAGVKGHVKVEVSGMAEVLYDVQYSA